MRTVSGFLSFTRPIEQLSVVGYKSWGDVWYTWDKLIIAKSAELCYDSTRNDWIEVMQQVSREARMRAKQDYIGICVPNMRCWE